MSKQQTVSREVLERQRLFSAEVRHLNEDHAALSGVPRKAFVRTYGCQQNVADGERIKGLLEEMGYALTEDEAAADFILFNTCAIREHAEDRVFGNVGALKHYKRRRPSILIGLCGCMVQQEHVPERIQKSFPFVSLVFGTHVIHKLPEYLYRAYTERRRIFDTPNMDGEIAEGLPIHRDGSTKAWLSIMYGCNNFCSYCVVPHVRGRERSREPEEILKEAESLVASGYKDITLLGQNVNSYGKTLKKPVNFAELMGRLQTMKGDYLLRFMTSHPKDATRELMDTMAAAPRIAKHLHLPFQSGNNRILKAMNRGYTRERYLELIAYAREKMPGLSITSDVIVGFPGETYEEFCDTLSLIKEVEFTSLYTFIFSPRRGTPAYELDDPVPYAEKSRWFTELIRVQEEISARRCGAMVGETVRVLVEEETKNGQYQGRTQGNIIVGFEDKENHIGQFLDIEITAARNWILGGKIIKNEKGE